MKIKKQGSAGFTMIELLMVIVLVAVLGTVALPQFLDFRKEGRISAATHRITIMRSALINMKAQLVLRCSAPGDAWPTIGTINNNDAVVGGDCTTNQVTNTADRKLIDVGIVSLPQVLGEGGIQAAPLPYLCDFSLKATLGNLSVYSPSGSNGTSMWCYDNQGNFWAESTTYPALNGY